MSVGFKSIGGFPLGGGVVTSSPPTAGFRSMLSLWLGGGAVSSGLPPPPPTQGIDRTSILQPTPHGGMAGGIGRWTIQIPRQPKKKAYVFKRAMENQDRADIEDILQMLNDKGLL